MPNKPDSDPILSLLLSRRKELGLAQQAVADKAGISRRALVSIEAGNDCTLSTLRGLCAALDLKLDALAPPRPSREAKSFATAEEMSQHQADRELAEALMVQALPPDEYSRWLHSSWGRLQQQANRLYADVPRSTVGHARHFKSMAEKNRFDEARETQFAVDMAMRLQ
jgi:transcriptional regulator with XRE-family HTH domain